METPGTYTTDFPRLATLLLPTPLRKPGVTALLSVLASAFSKIKALLLDWRLRTHTEMQYNGQVCRMEKCLNDKFNDGAPPGSPRITVIDGQQTADDMQFYYRRGATPDIDFTVRLDARNDRHFMLRRRGYNAETHFDFAVVVPGTIAVDEATLASVVNAIKAPGVSWELQRI